MKNLLLVLLLVSSLAFASEGNHEGGGATVGNGTTECSELAVQRIRFEYPGSLNLKRRREALQELLMICPEIDAYLLPEEAVGF